MITEGFITFYNNDPTDYSWDAEGGGNIPTNDVIGCTMIWDGGSYTIQSFDGFTFTMTDGAVLIFESPGEVYDAVTDTQGGGSDETFTFTYYVPTTGDGGEFTCPKSYTWEQFINSEYNVGGVFVDDTGGGVMDNDCNAIGASLDDLVYDTFGGGSGDGQQYLHTITFECDGVEELTMTLVNNSSESLSGEYEMEDTYIYNGAIIEGYESCGTVIAHRSNDGGGNCYLELEDGTQVNSYYGYYTDTVTEYGGGGGDSLTVTINGKSYPITAGMTWGDFIQEHSEFYTDYTCYYPPCCNSELYLDDIIILDDGENFTMLNGSDGSLPLYSSVINPYIEYGSYNTAIFDILHT